MAVLMATRRCRSSGSSRASGSDSGSVEMIALLDQRRLLRQQLFLLLEQRLLLRLQPVVLNLLLNAVLVHLLGFRIQL